MKHSRQLIIGISAYLALAVWPASADNSMCAAIRWFATSQIDRTPHTVELLTDWGGQFSAPGTIASKQCLHNGYPPGQELCKYLLANASTEFAQDNLERALACLADSRPRSRNLLVELLHVRYSSLSVPGVSGHVGLTLELNRDKTDGPPSLKITTELLSD